MASIVSEGMAIPKKLKGHLFLKITLFEYIKICFKILKHFEHISSISFYLKMPFLLYFEEIFIFQVGKFLNGVVSDFTIILNLKSYSE